MPTAVEMEQHRIDGHLPYRDWCPDCVEGFGREWARASHGSLAQRAIPLISCDYLFITEKGIFARGEWQKKK